MSDDCKQIDGIDYIKLELYNQACIEVFKLRKLAHELQTKLEELEKLALRKLD